MVIMYPKITSLEYLKDINSEELRSRILTTTLLNVSSYIWILVCDLNGN